MVGKIVIKTECESMYLHLESGDEKAAWEKAAELKKEFLLMAGTEYSIYCVFPSRMNEENQNQL